MQPLSPLFQPVSAPTQRRFFAGPPGDILPTGFAALDRLLPGGGWPAGGVTEIVAPPGYLDPVTLLLPALARLSHASEPRPRWIGWLAPPHLPVADDLGEQNLDLQRVMLVHRRPELKPLQTLERALQAGRCCALLAWLDELDDYRLRGIIDAATRHHTTVFLFRPGCAERQLSSAELRLFVATHSERLEVEILQSRCRPGAALRLASPGGRALFTPRYYRRQPPTFAEHLAGPLTLSRLAHG